MLDQSTPPGTLPEGNPYDEGALSLQRTETAARTLMTASTSAADQTMSVSQCDPTTILPQPIMLPQTSPPTRKLRASRDRLRRHTKKGATTRNPKPAALEGKETQRLHRGSEENGGTGGSRDKRLERGDVNQAGRNQTDTCCIAEQPGLGNHSNRGESLARQKLQADELAQDPEGGLHPRGAYPMVADE